jgi:hypothetical protein
MADYYLVPSSAKMHILTNGKGSIASNSTAVISSGITLNVGSTFSTTSNIASYGPYYTNGSTAMQIPAGDTSNRPTTAGPGYMRYNTDKDVIEYYRGAIATWLPLYSPPQLNSIDVSLNPSTYIPQNQPGTVYLNLRGYNFENVQTPLVFFYGLDGSTNFISPSVTWVSYNRVIAQVPSGVYTGTSTFILSVSPYSVRITSSISGMSQTLVNALPVGSAPIFNESQTNPLTLTYFNSRSYKAGTFTAGQTGVGIGNYISAFTTIAGQAITFSIDGSNNTQYAAPYNLDLSWNPSPIAGSAGTNYYAYFTTKVGQSISNTAVSSPTIITLGVVATNTTTFQSTKAAFKITINPYYIVSNFTANSGPTSGSVTTAQGYVTNSYPGYYTALYNTTTNTTPTYTVNTYTTQNYPTSWTTPTSSTTFRYNFNVTSLGCPGTTADPSNNNFIDFLLVGGGGGGGNGYQGGGGGGGGLISSNSNFGSCGGGSSGLTSSGIPITSIGTYVIQVGGGGCGAVYQLSSYPNQATSPNQTAAPPLIVTSPTTPLASSPLVAIPGSPAFPGDNTTFLGFTAAGGGYGGGEMNFLNNGDGNSAPGVSATTGITSPLQGATNMSVNGLYGTLSTLSPQPGTGSGNPWYIGPSLYNPRCDWNPLAGGCGGGGCHGQLTQISGNVLYGAVGNYDPTVSLSGSSITGPTLITGATCVTNSVTYTFNQGYSGGNGWTSNPYTGGGGGGASTSGVSALSSGTPGPGGDGLRNSIASSSGFTTIPSTLSPNGTYYACGGGGANRGTNGYTAGGSNSYSGGAGKSFNGYPGNTNPATTVNPTDASCNGTNGTGTGGGSWGQPGVGNAGKAGSGGNGISIIRYPRVAGIT